MTRRCRARDRSRAWCGCRPACVWTVDAACLASQAVVSAGQIAALSCRAPRLAPHAARHAHHPGTRSCGSGPIDNPARRRGPGKTALTGNRETENRRVHPSDAEAPAMLSPHDVQYCINHHAHGCKAVKGHIGWLSHRTAPTAARPRPGSTYRGQPARHPDADRAGPPAAMPAPRTP